MVGSLSGLRLAFAMRPTSLDICSRSALSSATSTEPYSRSGSKYRPLGSACTTSVVRRAGRRKTST